jgi:hypothetical protein
MTINERLRKADRYGAWAGQERTKPPGNDWPFLEVHISELHADQIVELIFACPEIDGF